MLPLISEYTGRHTMLSLVCHSWRDIIYENDDNILSDIEIKYSTIDHRVESVSEMLRIAIDTSDHESIRMISTVYSRYIPIQWDIFSTPIHDPALAWYFSFRVRKGIELDRLALISQLARQYCREHVTKLGDTYNIQDIKRILKGGVIDRVWRWMTNTQRVRARPIIDTIVGSFYSDVLHPRDTKRRVSIPVLNIDIVPCAKNTVSWLHDNGFLHKDPLMDAIIQDDVQLYKFFSVEQRYLHYVISLARVLDAVNIYHLIKPYDTIYINGKFLGRYLDDKDIMLSILESNPPIPSHIVYVIWTQCPIMEIKIEAYKIAIKHRYMDILDMIITKSNYMKVIMDVIQPYGMYDALYDLLIFKQIHAEWFSYYLPTSIDPMINLPQYLLSSKKNMMTLPRTVEDWSILYVSLMNVGSRIRGLNGVRAPSHIWPSLIGNAILYDIDGKFLSTLVREHALEITSSMISKMKILFAKNMRDGGWPKFVQTMISLGVHMDIASS